MEHKHADLCAFPSVIEVSLPTA